MLEMRPGSERSRRPHQESPLMQLSTLAKLKAHIGIPSGDTTKDLKLDMILDGVSNYIEGQTARKLQLQLHDLKLSGDGSDELVLPHYPILVEDESGQQVAAVASLEIDSQEIDIDAELASGDLEIDAEAGIIYRKSGWSDGSRNIRIVYSAGYDMPGESGDNAAETIPADLELAAIRLAARVYERSTAEGVASASPGGASFTYKDAVDDEIKETINRYSRVRVR